MVRSMLAAAGVEVADLGRVTVEGLLDQVRTRGYRLVLVSVLMLPSALRVRALVDGLHALGLEVPVIVGGAPFRLDPELAARVGATAHGTTAADAVALVARYGEGAR
jgi:methanogenic corrinoid protein MtbC1